jgi:hypothetical protein
MVGVRFLTLPFIRSLQEKSKLFSHKMTFRFRKVLRRKSFWKRRIIACLVIDWLKSHPIDLALKVFICPKGR